MVTDPPYGVELRSRLAASRRASTSPTRTGKVRNDERADWREAWALFPGDVAYVWHGALHATTVAESLERSRASTSARRSSGPRSGWCIGRGDYHWQHEPCWYAVRNKGNWTGDRKQTTLWTIPSGGQDAETIHGTQKPVECMRRPMLNNSEPGPGGLRAVPRQRHHADRRRDRRAASASRSSSTRSTSTSRSGAGRRSPARRPRCSPTGAPSMQSAAERAVSRRRPHAARRRHAKADGQPWLRHADRQQGR